MVTSSVLATETPPEDCLWLPGNPWNCVYPTQTAIALGTLPATVHPTSVAGTPTPEGLDFGGSPTPFTASGECPAGSFSPDGLQPEWVAACIHCLPATPTRTPGGLIGEYTFADHTLDEYSVTYPTEEVGTAAPATVTLTPSPTFTPSATFTPDPMGEWVEIFDFAAYGQSHWSVSDVYIQYGNWITGDGIYPACGAYCEVTIKINGDWAALGNINDASFITDVIVDGFAYGDFNINYSFIGYEYPIAGGAFHREWHGSWDWYDYLTGSDLWFIFNQGSWNYEPNHYVKRIEFRGYGYDPFQGVSVPTATPTSSPTPSPTVGVTNTPTPSGTWSTPTPDYTATATPDRSFRPQADCREPLYVHTEPIVDVVMGASANTCFRIFPEVHLNNDTIVSVHINVPPVDMCFDFYDLNVNFIGITLDVGFWVTVGLALLLFRFGLFSG